jgi:rhamnosyl/mannosyltransferase
MKVTHICKGFPPDTIGGMEQVVREIASGTSALGVNVEIICLSNKMGNCTETKFGHKVHFQRTSFRIAATPISISAIFQVPKLVSNTDIVHYHFPYPFSDVIHFLRCTKKLSVVTYHSDIIRQRNLINVYRPLMHRFLSSVDRIVATSPNYFKSSEVLSRYRRKTNVIPIGLNRTHYSMASDERLRYWEHRLGGKKFFLFIGVMRYYKGLFVLLEAAKRTGYPVVVVGAGPLEKKLRSVSKRDQIKNVEFTGFLAEEDKIALLTLCYGLILPSTLRAEAFGISLVEGALFSKPLISCEIGTGTSFINVDKETGLIVRPGDPASLKSAMTYLWNHSEEAAAMGARAKLRYVKWFDAQKMAQSYLDLYGSLARAN